MTKPKVKKYTGLRCTHCGTDIYSMYQHDFVSCTCGRIYVDGGQGGSYTRVGFTEPTDFLYVTKTEVNGKSKLDAKANAKHEVDILKNRIKYLEEKLHEACKEELPF